ncbi:MAG: cation:proton antiporter, partial [Streptosporangiaceae bacterium]
RLRGREIVVLSWAGPRGVISLAAIFTLPLTTSAGHPFPDRDLLLLCTYIVVVVTLVGQGVTFGPIARALGVRADPAEAAALRNEARAVAVQAGLSRLEQITAELEIPGAALAGLRPPSTASCGGTSRPRHRTAPRTGPTRPTGPTPRTGPTGRVRRRPPGRIRRRSWTPGGPSSTPSARNCCAGVTPAGCRTLACASSTVNSTTRNAP